MTVSTVFPLYLAHLEHEGRADSTLGVYRSIYRRWLDGPLRDLPVNELADRTFESAIDQMRNRVPPSRGGRQVDASRVGGVGRQ